MTDKCKKGQETASFNQDQDYSIEYGFIPTSWPDFPDELYGSCGDLRRKLSRNLKPVSVREGDHIDQVVATTRQIQSLRYLQFEAVAKALDRVVSPKLSDYAREQCSPDLSKSDTIAWELLVSHNIMTKALFGDQDILQATDGFLRQRHQLSWGGLLVEVRQQVMVQLEELQQHIEACESERQAALKKFTVIDQRKARLLAQRSNREIAKVPCSPPGLAVQVNSPTPSVSACGTQPANTAMAAPDFG